MGPGRIGDILGLYSGGIDIGMAVADFGVMGRMYGSPLAAVAFRLQAVARNGILYSGEGAARERYGEIGEIAVSMLAGLCQCQVRDVEPLLQVGDGYATPVVDVRGAVFEEDRILLVRSEPDSRWLLPGGWAQVNVSPAENTVIQVGQTIGRSVQTIGVMAVWNAPPWLDLDVCFPTYVIVLECSSAFTSGLPAEDGRFFSEAQIMQLRLGDEYRRRLSRLFWLRRNGGAPEFD